MPQVAVVDAGGQAQQAEAVVAKTRELIRQAEAIRAQLAATLRHCESCGVGATMSQPVVALASSL